MSLLVGVYSLGGLGRSSPINIETPAKTNHEIGRIPAGTMNQIHTLEATNPRDACVAAESKSSSGIANAVTGPPTP